MSSSSFMGIEVAGESTLRETAEVLGVSERTVQRWERRGLPSRGHGRSKRYFWPHTAWWARAWNLRLERGDQPSRISMAEAAAWHRKLVAELDLVDEGVQP